MQARMLSLLRGSPFRVAKTYSSGRRQEVRDWHPHQKRPENRQHRDLSLTGGGLRSTDQDPSGSKIDITAAQRRQLTRAKRSEERRVGKECRSRWSPDHSKKKK